MIDHNQSAATSTSAWIPHISVQSMPAGIQRRRSISKLIYSGTPIGTVGSPLKYPLGCGFFLAAAAFGPRTGSERTPRGPRTDPDPIRTDAERNPRGLRTDPERIPNGSRTDPERTPNGPRRIPNGPRMHLERTPKGARMDPERTPNEHS